MFMVFYCVMGVNNIFMINIQFIDELGLFQGLINSKGDVDFIVIFFKFFKGKIIYNFFVVLELFFCGFGIVWFISFLIL